MKVYYYSRCTTCRKVIKGLKDNGLEPELREISVYRLSREEIKDILASAGITPKEALRKKHRLYRDILSKGYTDDEIVDLMVRDPTLIERPIVIVDGKVYIKPDLDKLLGNVR
jgi:arsenate reductase